jgi:hypothetical protein
MYGMGWDVMRCCYRIGGDIKETSPAAAAIDIIEAEKMLLSMTSNLSWIPSLDKIARNSSPISFSHFLQSKKESPVLLLCPWHSCFTIHTITKNTPNNPFLFTQTNKTAEILINLRI